MRAILLAVLLAACTFMPPAASAASEQTPGGDHAYIMLIRLRSDLYGRWKATGKWPDDEAANAALDAHGKYWNERLKAGRALIAGGMGGDYWDNVALIVFKAASQQEAEAIAANDPAVKDYVFQAQVRPFDISFVATEPACK